jgi:lysophospholipase L1-like esterase
VTEDRSADSGSAGALSKLFVLGDSISIHYGPFLEERLKGNCLYERKAAPIGRETTDLDTGKGANGGDSSMVLDYLEKRFDEPTFRPDMLLLNCGLHDIKTDPATGARQIPEISYRINLTHIVDLLAGRSIQPAWIRTTHCVDRIHNSMSTSFSRYLADVDRYNHIADEVMKNAGIPIIDLYGFTRSLGDDGELFRDHVHFLPAICAQQAEFIATSVNEILAVQKPRRRISSGTA